MSAVTKKQDPIKVNGGGPEVLRDQFPGIEGEVHLGGATHHPEIRGVRAERQ